MRWSGFLWQGIACQQLDEHEFALWAALIGLWSDAHFYATHRLLHTPWLYRRVHKLHHRSHNTDPLSGLSMHAAEHALYFSALLPAAVPGLVAVPFWAVQALSIALVLYPIPSHLAIWPFERHHWLHHTEFNYNYGSSQLFDELCGTTFGAYAARVAAKKAGGKGAEQEGGGVAVGAAWRARGVIQAPMQVPYPGCLRAPGTGAIGAIPSVAPNSE